MSEKKHKKAYAVASKENIYKLSVDKVYEELETSPQGLTQAQVEENQKKQGKNVIAEKKKKSILLVFLSNFTHLMAILLWVGGCRFQKFNLMVKNSRST